MVVAKAEADHASHARRAIRRHGEGNFFRVGCVRKRNRSGRILDVCAPACGVLGDGFSKYSQNADDMPLLAIPQHEEIRRARAVIDVMSTDSTLATLDDDQVVEGLVGGVPFVA